VPPAPPLLVYALEGVVAEEEVELYVGELAALAEGERAVHQRGDEPVVPLAGLAELPDHRLLLEHAASLRLRSLFG
jgi:hypothetical protein